MAMTAIPYSLEIGMKESIGRSGGNVNLGCCPVQGRVASIGLLYP
jgi:hypothetical protein